MYKVTGVKPKHVSILREVNRVVYQMSGKTDQNFCKRELKKWGGDEPGDWLRYLKQITKGILTTKNVSTAYLKYNVHDFKVEMHY